ncbi:MULTISPECIES: hypothetical protein [unclassified Luteococcus]|uniref:hypothetical protein n=1 Tax=unclassified Luteococcus TaxID=2639923 RepID=UPI00313EB1FB
MRADDARTRREFLTVAGAGLVGGLLAACSGDPATSSTATPTPVTRVAVLDWERAEDVLSLGLQPVAAPEVAAFTKTLAGLRLASATADLGTRAGGYRLAELRSAQPQLLLGTLTVVPAAIRKDLEQIAPLHLLDGPSNLQPLARARQNLARTGGLLGRGQRADALTTALDHAVGKAREDLRGRVHPGTWLVQFTVAGKQVQVHHLGPGSAAGMQLDQVGIINPGTDLGDPRGVVGTDLAALKGAEVLLVVDDAGYRTARPLLAKDPAWRAVHAVRAKRVWPVLAGRSPFGGVGTLTTLVQQVAAAHAPAKEAADSPSPSVKK